VTLQLLFDNPTIAQLASSLEDIMRKRSGINLPPIASSQNSKPPLSHAQLRLWFFDRLAPGETVFNLAEAVRMRGPLDIAMLEQSFTELIRRHQILRTSFPEIRGEPFHQVHPVQMVRIELTDLGQLSSEEQQARVFESIAIEEQKVFNLATGPLMRASLLRLAEEEHVLVVGVHHIIFDAWSANIFLREIAELYEALVFGRPPALPDLQVQYSDYAAWEHFVMAGEFLEKHAGFWREHLHHPLPVQKLPWDHARPESQSFRGGKQEFSLDKELVGRLVEFSRKHSGSLFITLLSAFNVLMRHYSGDDDVVVGIDAANRSHAELEGLIGFFVNQLPIRTDLSGGPSFREINQRVRGNCLACLAHQEMPFDKIVDVLKVERKSGQPPLFQVKLVLDNTPVSTLTLFDLELTRLESTKVAAKLDLTLLLREKDGGLQGWFEYNRDLFEPDTIRRIAALFEIALQSAAADCEMKLPEMLVQLRKAEKGMEEMERKQQSKIQFSKFKAIKPQMVTLGSRSMVKQGFLPGYPDFPLVIEPESPDTDLTGWATQEKETLEKQLLKHGAILFRGFGIDSAAQFNDFVSTLCPQLFDENGEHPRASLGGKVYTPVFYPPEKKLLWHNENSFNQRWPMKIWFFSLRPADIGGETPIADSRRVFELLDPGIRRKFLEKGVMYVRNYREGLGLDWPTVFQTSDRAQVEARGRAEGFDVEWTPGGHLRTLCVRPAAARHPGSGEMVFFSQLLHWHPAALDPETRDSLTELFRKEDFPRHCAYGDGSAIEDSVLHDIAAIYSKIEVAFPWQRGDILMLDNMLTAHARNPFRGERKLCVAMGEMFSPEAA
jgi:alpha-ketoglutarate-dependent taurine dioxygenase